MDHGADRTALYRFYNQDGGLIYVGVTYQLKTRLYQHARDKPWWPEVARKEVDWYENRELALDEEERLIELHDPSYNGSHARTSLKEMNKRIDAAAARVGMSRARWLREVVAAAVRESETQAEAAS